MVGKHRSGGESKLGPGTRGKSGKQRRQDRALTRPAEHFWPGPGQAGGQEPPPTVSPPVEAAVQLAEGRGQPLLQDVVDDLLRVVAIVLQAGQDEALPEAREQVLHLGDERVQLHTTHWGPQGGSGPQAL